MWNYSFVAEPSESGLFIICDVRDHVTIGQYWASLGGRWAYACSGEPAEVKAWMEKPEAPKCIGRIYLETERCGEVDISDLCKPVNVTVNVNGDFDPTKLGEEILKAITEGIRGY